MRSVNALQDSPVSLVSPVSKKGKSMNFQVVSFHCVFKDSQGRVLGSFFKEEVVNQAGLRRGKKERWLQGLLVRIQNVREGERRHFKLSARDAYGHYDPALVVEVQRTAIQNGFWLRTGSEVAGRLTPRGPRLVFRVTRATEDSLVLDANHPFAGQDLLCEVEITSARLARREDFGPRGRSLH